LVYFGERVEESIERVVRCGYDAIELVGEPDHFHPGRLRRALDAVGLGVSSICSVYTAERDLAHPDAGVRRRALEYVRDVADFAAAVGAPVMIIGPTAVMKTQRLASPEQEYGWALEGIRAGGEYAASVGVDLTLECWNRYETYFLNRLEQARAMWAQTGLSTGGVMGDTFHMNIEEASIAQAIRASAGVLNHVHLADSNRAAPGAGHIDFAPVLAALADIDYQGYLAFELLPAAADPFAVMRAGGHTEFFDRYTEQALREIKALEAGIRA
jgi:sugar phosphate isomerase/epimerase